MIVKEATKMYFFFGRERHILAGRIPGGHAKWVEWLNGSSKKHQKPKWFTYLLLWSKIGVVSFETLVFASKIFRCWRLIVPVFRCFVPWKNMMVVVKTAGGGSQSRSEEDYRSLWPSQGRCFLPRPFCGSGDVKSCEPNNSEVGFHRVSTNKKWLYRGSWINQPKKHDFIRWFWILLHFGTTSYVRT